MDEHLRHVARDMQKKGELPTNYKIAPLVKKAPDPNWVQSKKDSTILRRNLRLVRHDGLDAHHIVPGDHPRAAAAQQLLVDYQIDINASVNGVPLRRSGDPPAHHGNLIHFHDAIGEVTRLLQVAVNSVDDWGQARQRVIDTLASLRKKIELDDFPLKDAGAT